MRQLIKQHKIVTAILLLIILVLGIRVVAGWYPYQKEQALFYVCKSEASDNRACSTSCIEISKAYLGIGAHYSSHQGCDQIVLGCQGSGCLGAGSPTYTGNVISLFGLHKDIGAKVD